MNKRDKFVYDRVLTYLQKNRDYGNSVDKTRCIIGQESDLVRMADKVHRIEQLALKENEPKVAESIEDTILDLIIYMAIYESGKDFELEECSSVQRLLDLIVCIDDIATHPELGFKSLQEQLGKEILQDFTLRYIVNYIKTMVN